MEQFNIEYNFTSESRSFCTECEFLKSRCLCDTSIDILTYKSGNMLNFTNLKQKSALASKTQ